MRDRKLKRSVFILLLGIFVAVITPMYMLCFGIYQWGHKMTTDEILQSLSSRSSFFMKTLENEIIRIKQLQYECLNDDTLFYFVNAWNIMTRYSRTDTLLTLQKRLNLVYNSSSYIENVSVWIPHMNRMISAKRGVDPMTDEWERILSADADASVAGITYLDGEMYLCSAYPTLPADPKATPLYILIIQLSSQDIMEQLMSFNMYAEGGTMLSNFSQDYRIIVGEDIGISEGNGEAGLPVHNGGGRKYIVVKSSSDYLNMALYSYVSERLVYGDLYRYRNLFAIFTAVAFAMAAAYLWSANILVNRPIKRLVKSLMRVEQGELKVRIRHQSGDEFSYLYGAFNQMAASLENMVEINYRQRMLTQEAELKQLQAQINPHFLHNSFFILYRMAKDEDYENITEFLTYLSDYYRYITRNASKEEPLSSEIAHACRYVQIQLIRFKKRISVDFAPLPKQYESLPVPRLILQPLLENAFNHGLRDVAADGRLRVWYAEEDGTLVIKVEDNGAGMPADALEELRRRMASDGDAIDSLGVVNIHKRLRLKFGGSCGLRLTNIETGGLRSEIILPGINLTAGSRSEGEP